MAVTTRLRIDLAYDGTGFSGWAIQPGLRTVQAELERALARALRLEDSAVRTVVAGRTDSGVHATGQVCHVDLPGGFDGSVDAEQNLLRRLRGALGKNSDIWISAVAIAPPGFDARFSPLARRYEYRIADAHSTKDPRMAGFTLWSDDVLDITAMNQLGEALLGLHDFASFCRAREGATTIRELQEFSWSKDHDGVLVARVRGDAFCHSMVRSLVGAAVAVGRGALTVEDVVQARQERERTSLWKTLAAHGLTLCEVVYPADDELAERARRTRALREPRSD